MFIPIVLGTAREGAYSAKVANYFLEKAKAYGFETKLVSAGDYIEAHTARVAKEGNDKALGWRDVVVKADGFILIVPEYNHSFSGELKLLLDSLYKEYYGKVVGLVGVSRGKLGGARALEHIKPLINNFGMVAVQSAVLVSMVEELFDETLEIKDQSYEEKVTKLFDEVKWWAERLQAGR